MFNDETWSVRGNAFPDDVLLRVFHFLPLTSRVAFESVSRHWRALLLNSWSDVQRLIVWPNDLIDEYDDGYVRTYVPNADGNNIVLQGVLKKAGCNLKVLKFNESTCVDHRVVQIIADFCPNIETLSLQKVVFPDDATPHTNRIMESLLSLPRLISLTWNQNVVLDNVRQQRRNHHAHAGTHLSPFPSPNNVDSFMLLRNLRSVHLENVPILWGSFVYVCAHLAPTLENLCYKMWDHFYVPLRCTLMRGLQHLTNLKQLNVGGDRFWLSALGGLVDDDFALSISTFMPRLQRLSLKAGQRLGTKGVRALLQNLPDLQYLNLSQCDSVNNAVLEATCGARRRCDKRIFVYAIDTEVEAEKLDPKSMHNMIVLTDSNCMDETIFFGEETVDSVIV